MSIQILLFYEGDDDMKTEEQRKKEMEEFKEFKRSVERHSKIWNDAKQ